MPSSRRILLTTAAAALAPGTPVRAQDPAGRSVRLIAPFSEGGAADIAARRFARHAARHLGAGQPPIVVSNMPGASGAVGTLAVARAEPDGTTLLLARVASSAILPAIDPRTPFGPEDFTWLGLLDANPFVIVVPAASPWGDLAALLRRLREAAEPPLRFATSGPATLLDLGIRKMFVLAGLPIDAGKAVATRGGAEALAALLAGAADFMGNNLGDVLPALQDGRLRALMISGEARLPLLPGTPTAAEAGLPDMAPLAGWSALAGPAHLPEPVSAHWRAVIAATRADPGWIAETEAGGGLPLGGDGEAARDHVLAQIAFYTEIGRRLGLR